MALTLDQVLKIDGRPLQEVRLAQVLDDFGGREVLLRVGGPTSTVSGLVTKDVAEVLDCFLGKETNHSVAVGSTFHSRSALAELGKLGVIEVRGGVQVINIYPGKDYSQTTVLGVHVPGFFGYAKGEHYIPLRGSYQ